MQKRKGLSIVNLKFLERELGKELQEGRSERNRSVAKFV